MSQIVFFLKHEMARVNELLGILLTQVREVGVKAGIELLRAMELTSTSKKGIQKNKVA